MPQIRLERVSKYYPQDKKQMAAVQEINLTVEQGEFLFLTGSSGAGKSTLLQLISGDLRPTSGAVFLDDINLTRLSRLRRDRLYKPGFRRLWLWSACLMWERVTQWSYPMGSAAGWNWPARLSTARPFWFWMS